jgi:hypothetical protein
LLWDDPPALGILPLAEILTDSERSLCDIDEGACEPPLDDGTPLFRFPAIIF